MKRIYYLKCIVLLLLVSSSVAAQTLAPGGFSVFIFADMEGCSGLTNRDQMLTEDGPLMMAEDINACVAACFDAGAKSVIVRDGHGGGKNVDPTLIAPRAKLIQGPTPGIRFQGIAEVDAVILLGYHAKAMTPAAIMAHSYSSAAIQSMYLNGKAVGEIGVDAAIAAEYKVPVIMVSGDDKTCMEAEEWIPGVVTCQVKIANSASSGVCLPLEESHALIASKTKEALLRRAEIPLISVNYPATLRREFIPEGSPRVYSADFKPVPNPKFKEQTGDRVEKLLLGE